MAKAKATPDMATLVAAVVQQLQAGGVAPPAPAPPVVAPVVQAVAEVARPEVIRQYDEENGTLSFTTQFNSWKGKTNANGNVGTCGDKFEVVWNGMRFTATVNIYRTAIPKDASGNQFDAPYVPK